MGAGMGVGKGVRRMGGLPSTRALEILAARAERPLKEGFQTSRVGVLEWSLGSEGGPLPSVRLGPTLFLAGGREESVTRVNRLTSRSMILTLREVLTKRHCVLKARLEL